MADGQGDRLRSYEAITATPTLRTEAQDLLGLGADASGQVNPPGAAELGGDAAPAPPALSGAPSTGASELSALVSDGSADNAYLLPGNGQAPLSAYAPTGKVTTYLGTDLLGSVRLLTNKTDSVLGAGAYDAWGNARPLTTTSAGQAQLATLQGLTPFGYAGQLYDAGPGTDALRARVYDPTQGQFRSVDPLLEQTGQPYLYADDNPVDNSDPSGQNWEQDPAAETGPIGDAIKAYLINTFIHGDALHAGDSTQLSFANVTAPGTAMGAAHADLVSISPTYRDSSGRLTGQMYDVVPDHTINFGTQPVATDAAIVAYATQQQEMARLSRAVQTQGLPAANAAIAKATKCHRVGLTLKPGGSYPLSWGDATSGRSYVYSSDSVQQFLLNGAGGPYIVFAHPLATAQVTGLIGFSVCRYTTSLPRLACQAPAGRSDPCAGEGGNTLDPAAKMLSCGIDFVMGGMGQAIQGCAASDSGCPYKVIGLYAGLFLAGHVLGPVVSRVAVRLGLAAMGVDALRVYIAKQPSILVDEAGGQLGAEDTSLSTVELRGAAKAQFAEGLCPYHCFPAGTQVATAAGSVAIEKLHVGDRVLAENTRTGHTELEPVLAVWVRPRSTLMAIALSDGSTLKVTPNHLFWVDGGPMRVKAGWIVSGQLRVGDRLRTASGGEVTVTRVRRNVGRAVVYTLTIAQDHTFFVGSARVLVHNSPGPDELCDPTVLAQNAPRIDKFPSKVVPATPDQVAVGRASTLR